MVPARDAGQGAGKQNSCEDSGVGGDRPCVTSLWGGERGREQGLDLNAPMSEMRDVLLAVSASGPILCGNQSN